MWSSGDLVVARYRSGDGQFRGGLPLTVVEDGDEWLVAYLAPGTRVAKPVLEDGRDLRDVPLEERWAHPRGTSIRPWRGGDLVLLFPRDGAYSLWLFREGGQFLGWYVNLEDRHVRGERTIDSRDGILDVWVPADTREPQWKDEDELEAATSHGRLTPEQARAIRAEGERVIAERPWPTGWEDFEPDPSWPVPELPAGWDVL
jgi:Protein of unknown function (DUF402)